MAEPSHWLRHQAAWPGLLARDNRILGQIPEASNISVRASPVPHADMRDQCAAQLILSNSTYN